MRSLNISRWLTRLELYLSMDVFDDAALHQILGRVAEIWDLGW